MTRPNIIRAGERDPRLRDATKWWRNESVTDLSNDRHD